MTIYPMKTDKKRNILIHAILCALGIFALIWFSPKFFNTVMDRLENQREAEAAYYYQHYGDAIDKWEAERRANR